MSEEEEYEEEEDDVVSQNKKNESPKEVKNPSPEPEIVQKAEDKKETQSKKTKSTKKSNKAKTNNTAAKVNSNAYKLPSPENVVSTRSFLESTVTKVIEEALLDLARKRDEIDDPLTYVGEYLIKRAKEIKQ